MHSQRRECLPYDGGERRKIPRGQSAFEGRSTIDPPIFLVRATIHCPVEKSDGDAV